MEQIKNNSIQELSDTLSKISRLEDLKEGKNKLLTFFGNNEIEELFGSNIFEIRQQVNVLVLSIALYYIQIDSEKINSFKEEIVAKANSILKLL